MIIKLKDGTVLNSSAVTTDAIMVEYDSLSACSEFIEKVTEENVSEIEIDGVKKRGVKMNGNISISVSDKFIATAFLEFPSELEEIKAQIVELQDALMEIVEG